MSKKNYQKTVTLERLEVGADRIDRNAGVIKGVKVLGFQSRNPAKVIGVRGPAGEKPYRYLAEAVKAAIPLYEGAKVNIDHPELVSTPEGRVPKSGRKFGDGFGWLENVRLEADGLYADLHYLKSHEEVNRVLEWAERRSDAIALSHNALSQPTVTAEGECVITRIVQVNSVDLIREMPGTTNGLFESAEETDSLTVSDAIVSLRECLSDELTDMERGELKDLMTVLESTMKTNEGEKPEDGTTPVAAAGKPSSPVAPAAAQVIESVDKAALDRANKKLAAVRTLESAGVQVTESRLELMADANDAIAAELCKGWKADPQGQGVESIAPKSAAPPKPTLESAADQKKQPKDRPVSDYIAAFRGGSLN